MTDPGLTLDDLCISLAGDVLIRLDTRVAPGEVLTVMGPSGTGKSTLLAALIGVLDPAFRTTGRVLLDGQDITHLPPEKRRIGILYQDDLLFPHLSVGDNLGFGLARGVRGGDRRRTIDEALHEVGLDGFSDRDPATLSGGQKARVALMRVLLSEPRALLLDEPFSSLDADRRDQMRSLVFTRARERGLPVMMVTHDESDARAAGGTILRIGS